jgi:NAD(P)H-flavin reductase
MYSTSSTVLLICGGTGIAPLYSMASDALRNDSSIHVVLVVAFRDADDVILDDKVADLYTEFFSRLKICYVFSRETSQLSFNGFVAQCGRLCADHVLGVVKKADVAVVCGPPSFGDDVADILEEHSITDPEKIIIM